MTATKTKPAAPAKPATTTARRAAPAAPAAKKTEPVKKAKPAPAPAARKRAVAAKKPVPPKQVAAAATAEHEKAKAKPKNKLVRDSFTIPKNEYVVLEALKSRALSLTQSVKKSELLRAGIAALDAMNDAAFLQALDAVPSLKTGRPRREPVAAPVAAADAS